MSVSFQRPDSGAHFPTPMQAERESFSGLLFSFVTLPPSTPEPRTDYDAAQHEGAPNTHFSYSTGLIPQRFSRSWCESRKMKGDGRQNALPPSLSVLTTVPAQHKLLRATRQLPIPFPCPRGSPHGVKPEAVHWVIFTGSFKPVAQRGNSTALYHRYS